MIAGPATPQQPAYAVGEAALRKWATQRLRLEPGPDRATVYSFTVSGSTCTNMGVPLEAVMTVVVGADGRIEAASTRPASGDVGCDAMCAAACDARRFFAGVGCCPEALGLTLHEAAFRDWQPGPSGCFCTEGNRRHKWRNVFQVLHYAATHQRVE